MRKCIRFEGVIYVTIEGDTDDEDLLVSHARHQINYLEAEFDVTVGGFYTHGGISAYANDIIPPQVREDA